MLLNPFKNIAFSKAWFNQFNYLFTYLLNNKSFKLRSYLRDKLKLNDFDYNTPIVKLTPNSVHYQVTAKDITATFYSYERIANLMKIEFENIFIALHSFDINIANKFIPVLNLGYDTLTAYSSTADGRMGTTNTVWATARGTVTGSFLSTGAASGNNVLQASFSSPTYTIYRSFFYFDTSSMGAGSTVTAAVFSLYRNVNGQSSVSAQQGTQSATLSTSNFSSFTGSLFGSAAWTSSTYNDISLASNGGYTYVNNNATAYLAAREYDHDYLNAAPDAAYLNGCYFSDNTGTTQDPKLVITYSAGATATTRSYIY